MNFNKILKTVNNKLRFAVKSIGMGGYINSLSDSGPLRHGINTRRRDIAFTGCNVFDGLHSQIKENMTVLVSGDKIVEVAHKEKLAVPESFIKVDLTGQQSCLG